MKITRITMIQFVKMIGKTIVLRHFMIAKRVFESLSNKSFRTIFSFVATCAQTHVSYSHENVVFSEIVKP